MFQPASDLLHLMNFIPLMYAGYQHNSVLSFAFKVRDKCANSTAAMNFTTLRLQFHFILSDFMNIKLQFICRHFFFYTIFARFLFNTTLKFTPLFEFT